MTGKSSCKFTERSEKSLQSFTFQRSQKYICYIFVVEVIDRKREQKSSFCYKFYYFIINEENITFLLH